MKKTIHPNIELEFDTSLDKLFRYHEWRHRTPLKDGIVTPGFFAEEEWDYNLLPSTLKGKSFLDAGANDGMYTFLALDKGASKAAALDIYSTWSRLGDGAPRGVDLVKEYLNSPLNILDTSLFDLANHPETYDYVFCSHVIAWLSDPFVALKTLADKCTDTLHLREAIVWPNDKPRLELVHDFEAKGSSWMYNGNLSFYETTLKGLGFKEIICTPIDLDEEARIRAQEYPTVEVAKGKTAFPSPWATDEGHLLTEKVKGKATYQINGFMYVTGHGWVQEEDVSTVYQTDGSIISKAKASLIAARESMKKTVQGEKFFYNYIIIARR